MRITPAAMAVLLLLHATTTIAQTTGALTGTVTTAGQRVPGATVTLTSPALQGIRTTVTGANGDYSFPALPPGGYRIAIELEGLQSVTKAANIRLAETVRVDAELSTSRVAESITVTAAVQSVIETPQVETSLTRETVESLPLERSIAQRIQLAPGVNASGVNKQTIVNGAPSYDNLYLVNGVVVNDTLRGQPEDLFIEDAIQETTLLTGGVSAEYGRFTGGVINTITKSGGNQFSGSLRDNLTNPSWTNVTRYRDPLTGAPQPKSASRNSNQYEATLGGYILKDALWFFGAGRKFNEVIANLTTATSIPYVNERDNTRYEGKLSGQITPRHIVIASYLHNDTRDLNTVFGNVVDLRSLTDRSLPNWVEDYHYSGVVRANALVEAVYSRRYLAIVGGGGPRDLIDGTMLQDNTTTRRMWSPTFCGVCGPKVRSNRDYQGKVSYFLATRSLGSHSVVAGYDAFSDLRRENNYKSGSDFRLWGDFVYDGPNVYFHANPQTGFIAWNPIAELSKTSDIDTKSMFINDKWQLNSRLSFNLGLRRDRNDALDQSHNRVANDSAISPRLGAIFDLRGDGRDRISATYARYVSKLDATIADTIAAGGQPALIYFNYRGPEINAYDPKTGKLLGPPVSPDQIIRTVFDWFNAQGGVNGYKGIDSIVVPGLTEKLLHGLQAPDMNEVTIGYGHQLPAGGYLRADLVHRSWGKFYTIRRDTTTGQTVTPTGSTVDVGVIGNSNAGLSRRYNGLQAQGAYRFGAVSLGGNYTLSTLRGNVEGETFNRATAFVGNDEYPEYKKFARNQPSGYLNEDVRHHVSLYANYDLALPRGHISLGALQRYQSGTPYSAIGSIDPRDGIATGPARGMGVVNPNGYYATPPSSVSYFFSGRGSYRLDGVISTDFTATYIIPTLRSLNVFLRADVVNVFDRQGVEFAATDLGPVVENRVYTRRQQARSTDNLVPLVAFNPYTTPPVRYIPGQSDPSAGPYNYQLDPNFGKATNKDAYQLPRTWRFAVGLRF